MQERHLCRHP